MVFRFFSADDNFALRKKQNPSNRDTWLHNRAKCLMEFGKLVEQEGETDLPYDNLSEKVAGKIASIGLKMGNGRTRKRRLEEYQIEKKKFKMGPSKHPVLYLDHVSKDAILVVEKPWVEVIKSLDTQPVDRHIFGT